MGRSRGHSRTVLARVGEDDGLPGEWIRRRRRRQAGNGMARNRATGATELGLPRPALGKMQGEAARRAGEPSGQGEDPPPEGLGGHHLLAQTDARGPASQVMCHHLDGQPGGVGGGTARLRDLRSFGILENPRVGGFT